MSWSNIPMTFFRLRNTGTKGGWQILLLMAILLLGAASASELKVNGGTGSGSYPQGTVVSITANAAPPTKVFLMWTGSTAYVADLTNPSITVTMPSTNVTLTALYANAPDYIKVSPNRRYLYQGGKPLLVIADTGWFILGRLGLSKFNSYVSTRASQGFTAIIATWLPQQPLAPSTAVPVTPFTPIDDIRHPNAAYWNNAKAACAYAKSKGITLFMTGSYIGPRADDWGAVLNSMTNAELVAYGQFLGNTFREYDNLVWVVGGDCLPTREGADRLIRGIKDGLKSAQVPQLITAHLPSPYSTGQYYHGEDWLDLNVGNDQRCYGTGGYTLTLADYQRFPTKPAYFAEPSYESRAHIEPDTYSLLTARRGVYWGLFSGSLGAAYGHMSVYGSASPLTTNTAKFMVGNYLRKLMLDNVWYTWQPDVDGTVLTGGGVDLEWCSKLHNGAGSLAMAYMPCKETINPAALFVPKPVTAKMSWFQGPVNVKWMKPDTGVYTDIGTFPNTGSMQFTPPGVGDWVLILKVLNPSILPDTVPPTVPQITATGIRPSAVEVTWPASTDNVETTGYEVFRDGKFLCTVTTPRLVDTGLLPNTRYVYQVTARDAAGYFSERSVPSEALTLTGWQQLYQAEAATVVGAKIISNYVDYVNASSDYIEWTVDAPFADTYSLLIRYALSTGNRPLEIRVNGVVVAARLSFPSTGSFSNYSTVNLYAPFNAGLNTIRATAIGASGGNLDWLTVISGGDPSAVMDTQPPSMPPNFAATSGGVGEAALGWGQSTDNVGVTGYDIIRDGVVVATNLQIFAYNDQGLDFAQTYVYAVRARDAAGNLSQPSASVSMRPHGIWDMRPPKVPTGLTATATFATSIEISWNRALDDMVDGVAGYEIYRNGAKVMFVPEPNRPENIPDPKPTWTDTGLSQLTSYSYAVQTVDKVNNVSGLSAPVTATTPALPDVTPPSVPQDLSASEITLNSVVLTWTASTDNSAIANYDVLRDEVVVATVTTTTWANSGLLSGVTYAYTIVARDVAGNVSAQSTPVPVTTLGDVTPPSIPTDVASSSLSSTSVTLNWSASTDDGAGPITYDVYRNSELITSTTALMYKDAMLSPLTTYVYTLKARDAADNASDFSLPLTITTVEPVTGPTFLMGINMNGGPITIDGRSWKTYDAALSSGFTISSPTGIIKTTSPQVPVPAPQDADVTPMLGTIVYATATMTMNQTLPNGKYSVYLWMMENYKNYFRKINVLMENTLVASNLCYVTLGTWNRYGPYTITVNDGALTITMTRSGTTGNPGLMGLEIWNAPDVSGLATRMMSGSLVMGNWEQLKQR